MKRKHGYKRGYPIALLVGFEDDRAVLWQIFSHVVKLHQTIKLAGTKTDEKALFSLHESVVDALKPMLEEGVRSIVVTAPMRTNYAADFLKHVQKHHSYLVQPKKSHGVAFAELVGSASMPHTVAELVKTAEFRELLAETTSREADQIVDALEKRLNRIAGNSAVLFSLKEIEDTVYDQERHSHSKTEYLMLTDKYLADSNEKNRIHRLLQISKNKRIKTKIVSAETQAGKRISQFGGIIFFTTLTKNT